MKIVLADPPGSALYSYVKTGDAVMSPGPSITEGIGNSRVTDNLAGTPIDDAVQISDQRQRVDGVSHAARRRLVLRLVDRTQSRGRGTTSRATSVPGTPSSRVLCDGGGKYQSRLFNPRLARASAV